LITTEQAYTRLMPRVLLIEDDADIRRLLAKGLADKGYDIQSTVEAMDGLKSIVSDPPDVVILDLGLPDLDGTELLRMIRTISQVPVIVATARGDDETVVATLKLGADDYVIKPFSVDNIEARISAVLRRLSDRVGGSNPISVGLLSVNPVSREVSLNGETLDLSPKEFDLLRLLAERQGEVVSKREILAEVWREPYGGSERTVDVHISWLRGKLGESASEPRYIRTVHGVGVKLVNPGL